MKQLKLHHSLKLCWILLTITSCSSIKDIGYFQNNESDSTKQSHTNYELYEARIKPKDMLSITIVSSEPEASRQYNLTVPQISEPNNSNALFAQPILQTYLVDNNGTINFPVFGKLMVAGLNTKELEAIIQQKLQSAFAKEHPIVTIRFTNYSVSILGEVERPGKYNTSNERLTLFEGLALAGDMTIYGKRENVKVLRERTDGSKVFITVNLNDKHILNSPAYYLEQNDVVYVEPNSAKTRTSRVGSAESLGVSAFSILISMASLVVTISK
jgi:polysaccharide export outer membrane protein